MALDTDHFILMFLALRASKSLFVVQTIVLGPKERNRVEAGLQVLSKCPKNLEITNKNCVFGSMPSSAC